MKRGILATLAVASAFAAAAQQPGAQPDLIERIGEGVKGFFNRMFGAPERKPAALPQRPPEPSAAPPAAQPKEPEAPAMATVSQALHAALARGDYLTVLQLIEQGADIEAKDPGAGASALHYAVMRGKMPVIDLLLTRGADVGSRSANGSTLLHTAVN